MWLLLCFGKDLPGIRASRIALVDAGGLSSPNQTGLSTPWLAGRGSLGRGSPVLASLSADTPIVAGVSTGGSSVRYAGGVVLFADLCKIDAYRSRPDVVVGHDAG